MKVRAKRLGFYKNLRRRVGDKFIIDSEKHYSENWMVKIGTEKEKEVDSPKKGKATRKKPNKEVI